MKPGYAFVLPWDLKHPGGVNQVVQNLLHKLYDSGDYTPHLIVLDWNGDGRQRWHDFFWLGHHRFRSLGGSIRSLKQNLAFLFFLLPDFFKLHKYIKENNIRTVNVHYPTRSSFLIGLYRVFALRKIRLIISLHGHDLTGIKASSAFAAFQWKLFFKMADSIVACSEQLEKLAIDSGFINDSDICTIHNGIDVDIVAKKLKEGVCVHNNKKKFIISIGTYEHKKGHDVLINAYSKLEENVQQQLDLVFVGRTGSTLASEQGLVSKLGIEDRVFFYKDIEHEDVLATLSNADLFILPSREEPFGLVLLEAALLDKPVIAAAVGGVPEVLGDFGGQLFEDENASQLAELIRKFVVGEWEDLNARKSELKRRALLFTWDEAFRKYRQLA